ncbi:MAG TPA: PP2C family protein-serine/threonine phosphatase [Tepidisphaeraceae bacterium]|jgi:sigma-B regulation protein RsbU (phosphoserine phosphatase)
MSKQPRSWQEELEIVDRTMRAISGVTDPETMVSTYWENIHELLPITGYVAVSRRTTQLPEYLVTRSSRFTERHDPWKFRERLPRLSGGLLGEILQDGKPMVIDNLPERLHADDPGYFYLEGFKTLVAFPQYDNGEALNVTMFLFHEGEEIDPARIPMIHWQSGLFGRGTQNLVLRNQLGDALSALDRELKVVGDIQRSLLPATLPDIPGLTMAAAYETSAQAGGDYYDFFELDGGLWGMFIADVAGHGTPAAVLMAVVHAIAHAKPDSHTPPAQLLEFLNRQLTRSYTQGGTFVTAFYAVYDPAARTLTYSMAGHNPPRLVRGDSVLSLDENGRLPLGIVGDQTYEQATIVLQPADMLLLYTDGITEAMSPLDRNSARELYGVERLDQLLLDCAPHHAQSCIEAIQKDVAAFSRDQPPTDDRTLIAIVCA